MKDLPPGQRACIAACTDWKKLKKRNKEDLAAKYGGSRDSWRNRMERPLTVVVILVPVH